MIVLRIGLALISFLVLSNLFGQRIEKVVLHKGSADESGYTMLYPPRTPWSGYIVIMPGFGESPEQVLEQTDLPEVAARRGLLTIIPKLRDGIQSFGVDSLSQASLAEILADIREKHRLENHLFYIGGFSIGGSCAVKFAQETTQKPKAVFAVDPPLDFERFYNACKRDLRLSAGRKPNPESVYMADRIEKEFNGTPQTARSAFHKISPYSFSDTAQTAVKKFENTAIRIYAEPDVKWWMEERGADITGMNIIDATAMINEINRLGNNSAELVLTENKGFRKPGMKRHPHSWSIVDSDDLIDWLLKQQ